jgi:hypothetical protein
LSDEKLASEFVGSDSEQQRSSEEPQSDFPALKRIDRDFTMGKKIK